MVKSVIAKNIKYLIEEKDMTQLYLASKAGYSLQQLNAMLNGRKVIRADDVWKISQALGCTPNDLYVRFSTESPRTYFH